MIFKVKSPLNNKIIGYTSICLGNRNLNDLKIDRPLENLILNKLIALRLLSMPRNKCYVANVVDFFPKKISDNYLELQCRDLTLGNCLLNLTGVLPVSEVTDQSLKYTPKYIAYKDINWGNNFMYTNNTAVTYQNNTAVTYPNSTNAVSSFGNYAINVDSLGNYTIRQY